MGLRSLGERGFVYIRKKNWFHSVVGGTKEIHWERCAKLKPDLVVFDKEENNKEMADSCPFPFHATHVSSIQKYLFGTRETIIPSCFCEIKKSS